MSNLVKSLHSSLNLNFPDGNFSLKPLFETKLSEEKSLISCFINIDNKETLLFELHLSDSLFCNEGNSFAFESEFYQNKNDASLGIFYFNDVSELDSLIKKSAEAFQTLEVKHD